MTPVNGKRYWLDSPENVGKLYRGLWIIGIALVGFDLLVHRHEQFGFAELTGFHAGYGFFACVILVLAAKGLRILLKRPEDYYER
jgi:hypothetical protein